MKDSQIPSRLEALESIVGRLSAGNSKLPGLSYDLPAAMCQMGSLHASTGNPLLTCHPSNCYAKHGFFPLDSKQQQMWKSFRSLTDERWVASMVEAIRLKRELGPEELDHSAFRWHSSGDIQGLWHLQKIVDVARLLEEEGVRFWVDTKEHATVLRYHEDGGTTPSNLIVRLSHARIGDRLPNLDRGFPVSTVSPEGDRPKDAWLCPADEQGGRCLDCRACWNGEVRWVDHLYRPYSGR